MSKVIDDAREKIAEKIAWHYDKEFTWATMPEWRKDEYRYVAASIPDISGTTDIECPECKGSTYSGYNLATCPHCDNGHTEYKWKVSVTLENGELPNYPGDSSFDKLLKSDIYLNSQDDMLSARYRQVVE